jgi:hypothetical protein
VLGGLAQHGLRSVEGGLCVGGLRQQLVTVHDHLAELGAKIVRLVLYDLETGLRHCFSFRQLV